MKQAALEQPNDHQDAVALVEEIAACLRLSPDYVRELTEQVTDQTWDDLDTDGAEAVAELLAGALHRTIGDYGDAVTPSE